MKAIISSIGIGPDGSKHRRISLRFPDSVLGDTPGFELVFDEAKLGIVGLQLGDELEFNLNLHVRGVEQ